MNNDLEQRAGEALGLVPIIGVDGLPKRRREELQYGLEHGLFSQEEVDAAQVQYKQKKEEVKENA